MHSYRFLFLNTVLLSYAHAWNGSNTKLLLKFIFSIFSNIFRYKIFYSFIHSRVLRPHRSKPTEGVRVPVVQNVLFDGYFEFSTIKTDVSVSFTITYEHLFVGISWCWSYPLHSCRLPTYNFNGFPRSLSSSSLYSIILSVQRQLIFSRFTYLLQEPRSKAFVACRNCLTINRIENRSGFKTSVFNKRVNHY